MAARMMKYCRRKVKIRKVLVLHLVHTRPIRCYRMAVKEIKHFIINCILLFFFIVVLPTNRKISMNQCDCNNKYLLQRTNIVKRCNFIALCLISSRRFICLRTNFLQSKVYLQHVGRGIHMKERVD